MDFDIWGNILNTHTIQNALCLHHLHAVLLRYNHAVHLCERENFDSVVWMLKATLELRLPRVKQEGGILSLQDAPQNLDTYFYLFPVRR